MSKDTTIKSKLIGFKVEPDLHAKALSLAKADGGISAVLQRYVVRYVARKEKGEGK